MRSAKRWLVLGVVLVILLPACSKSGGGEEETAGPVKLVAVDGTDIHRVVLTRSAITRIGLEVQPVVAAPALGTAATTVVPYAALLYDPGGTTWVYTTVGDRTFQRARVTVERVDDDDVLLTNGPPVGTNVVTVGAAEVYGSEFLSEHE